MINFEKIPSDLRVPSVSVEVDSSQSQQGASSLTYRHLIVGQKTADGTAAENSLHQVTSAEQVAGLAGRGSFLHRMAIAHRAINKFTDLWIGVLDDDVAGSAAAGSIVVAVSGTGLATVATPIPLYLGAVRLSIGVAVGDNDAAIAASIAAAVNADDSLPVTAVATLASVALTFRHTGEMGNEYDIRDSVEPAEALPFGVTLTHTQLTGGAGNPSLDTLIAAMGDTWFHVIAHAYTDGVSLGAIEAELTSRFGPMRSIDGVAVTVKNGSFSDLATLGGTRNSPHSLVIAQGGRNPMTPAFEAAAEIAAVISQDGARDPALPFQTAALVHTRAGNIIDRFTDEERNTLLKSGIGTTIWPDAGGVQLERMITTYQLNAAGANDTAYLDVMTMLTLMYLRYDVRTLIKLKYPRHKLTNDGVRLEAGQKTVSPQLLRGELQGWFSDMQGKGLVEDADGFKRDLKVRRSTTDANRMDVVLPPNLTNALIAVAISLQFRQ